MTSLDLLYLPNTTHRWPSQSFHKTSLGLLNVNPGPLSRPVFQHHRDTYLGLSGPMWHSQLLQEKICNIAQIIWSIARLFQEKQANELNTGLKLQGNYGSKATKPSKKNTKQPGIEKNKSYSRGDKCKCCCIIWRPWFWLRNKTCVSGLRSVRELTAPGLKTTSPARRKVLVAPMQKLWVGVFFSSSCLLHFQAPTQVIDLSVKWPSGSVIAS